MPTHDRLADVPTTPGRHLARGPVTVDLNGHDVAVWTHVLRGARSGPTLALLSGVHGNEWGHIEFLARLVREFQPDEVAGTVLVVPTANPAALGALTRAVPDDADQPDVNRSFPGEGRRFTWLAEQIATAIASEIVARADAILDFHLGIWGATMGSSIVGVDYSDPLVNRRCMDLALAFGTPLIFASRVVGAFPGPRSLLGYAAEKAGVPVSGSMLGGTGFERPLEEAWQAANLRGIRNVMQHLGMLQGSPDLPDRYLRYATVERVNPRTGGLLLPARHGDEFGRTVRKGEVLGTVVSPYSLEVIEELVVPMDGHLAYWARDYPVHPGDWAFGVIPGDHPGTESLERTPETIAPWS
jgi:predicted deacylase